LKEKNRAIVEGVNLISNIPNHNADNPQGGIVKKEAPIHVSNLMVLIIAGNATRLVVNQMKMDKAVRYSKKSGEVIK
jgi:large subunit ribosomal protein L24